MVERFCAHFEAALQKLADGLQKPKGEKNADKLLQRIGRLKAKSHGVSQHYTITLEANKADVAQVPTSANDVDAPKTSDGASTPDQPALRLSWTKQYVQTS